MIEKVFTQTDSGLVAHVTFRLPNQTWAEAICLVGDFNDWNRSACPPQRNREGQWFVTLELEPGRTYQFRYLRDGLDWLNDNQADAYVPNRYGSDNSVVVTESWLQAVSRMSSSQSAQTPDWSCAWGRHSMRATMVNSTTAVIFGASGDLTQRKLIPALFGLFCKQRLPPNFHIVGVARTRQDDDGFRQTVRRGMQQFTELPFGDDEWREFAQCLSYYASNFTAEGEPARLAASLAQLEGGSAHRLYYLATPPQFFEGIIAELGRAGMASERDGWRRVVIEKPFGHDLASARALNQAILQVLHEKQIYRMDHYLGKETVQNIVALRFGNAIFEPVWNRNYIDHVQITVAEAVSVGNRASYYDSVGVVRDMFQNHLLQLLALVAMEPPASYAADDLRNEKVKVHKAIRPLPSEAVGQHTVRGQYRGYREEAGVAPESQTATYAAMRLFVDNWRWQDVPFYLRSGKRLAEKTTEVIIQFKCPPHVMFPMPTQQALNPNSLALCIQPDEGIHLRFEAKVPDTAAEMRPVDMDFHYRDAFGPGSIPEAYERLLLDALGGDQSLFTRSDRAELAWALLDPVLARWHEPDGPPLAIYEPGGWGPTEADALLRRDGRAWLRRCGNHAVSG